MIIACPACNTRYAVPDTAIGVSGRTVRCAKCRHSWFQDGPQIDVPQAAQPLPEPPLPEPPPAAVVPPVAEPEPVAEPVAAQAPAAAPEAQPEPEPLPPPVHVAEPEGRPLAQVDDGDDGYEESQFYHEPPFRARRNPARMWMLAAALFAAISLGLIGAAAWFGLPDWAPFARTAFADEQPGLKLDFPQNLQERRTLPDKTIYYGLAGSITNTGSTSRSVPTLLIRFRDAGERIVKIHELVPPKQVLAPGESVDINEAIAGVPASAKFREIGWKPGS